MKKGVERAKFGSAFSEVKNQNKAVVTREKG